METLVVMDYSTNKVDIYHVSVESNIDEDWLKDHGHNPDECSWMFNEDISINFHNKIIY